ncbi:hypothetical protein KKB43_04315 [Patescibacteria group bacterium]|nr:hypothetical protein [Patescibacteria group bacterium]
MTLFKAKAAVFFLKIFLFVVILFLPLAANARVENCNTNKFYYNTTTKILTFPAGGGYNTDAKVSLPMQAVIGATKVDLTPKNVIGTPYIWIPNSGSNTLAQIRTSNGTLVKLYQNSVDNFPAAAFSNNSRITLIPGGDVWVANRGNTYVTWLEPVGGASEEYKYGGQVDTGATLNRGLTFDKNGNIWTGTAGVASTPCPSGVGTGDRLHVICASASCGGKGTKLASLCPAYSYGMIGDKYGIVWSQSGASVTSYKYSSGSIVTIDTEPAGEAYGIGIDNDSNIWIARWKANSEAWKVVRNSGGSIISVTSYPSGVAGGGRGIAGDGTADKNVWMVVDDVMPTWTTSTSRVIKYGINGNVLNDIQVGTGAEGVAIDFDNNVWIVNYNGGGPNFTDPNTPACGGSGSITKIKQDGTVIASYPTCGNNPYNYSDMTGFRSIPTTLSIGSTEFTPTAGTTYTGFGLPLQTALAACSCIDANRVEQCAIDPAELNSCLVPLALFSVTGGDYNATDLSIVCSITYPDITGGLVPCGRIDNNLATDDIDESAPCTLCAMFYMLKNIINFVLGLAIGIGVFILIIAGLLYALSAGNPRNIELAKTALNAVIVGLVIIFIAWLAIAVILQALGFASIATWNQVNCVLPT